jgi:hypothetical protein
MVGDLSEHPQGSDCCNGLLHRADAYIWSAPLLLWNLGWSFGEAQVCNKSGIGVALNEAAVTERLEAGYKPLWPPCLR